MGTPAHCQGSQLDSQELPLGGHITGRHTAASSGLFLWQFLWGKDPYTHFTDWNTMGGSPVTPGVCLSTLLFKNSQLTRFTRLWERPANMPLRPLPSRLSSKDNDSRCLWETGQCKGPQQLRGTKQMSGKDKLASACVSFSWLYCGLCGKR